MASRCMTSSTVFSGLAGCQPHRTGNGASGNARVSSWSSKAIHRWQNFPPFLFALNVMYVWEWVRATGGSLVVKRSAARAVVARKRVVGMADSTVTKPTSLGLGKVLVLVLLLLSFDD